MKASATKFKVYKDEGADFRAMSENIVKIVRSDSTADPENLTEEFLLYGATKVFMRTIAMQ